MYLLIWFHKLLTVEYMLALKASVKVPDGIEGKYLKVLAPMHQQMDSSRDVLTGLYLL